MQVCDIRAQSFYDCVKETPLRLIATRAVEEIVLVVLISHTTVPQKNYAFKIIVKFVCIYVTELCSTLCCILDSFQVKNSISRVFVGRINAIDFCLKSERDLAAQMVIFSVYELYYENRNWTSGSCS